MASVAFPALAKRITLSDGTTYGYVAQASTRADAITFLLLHGYPSSCYDWRHQIKSLSGVGYGVIAPDFLLGYGDTDKPEDPNSYCLKTMTEHIAEILDVEHVKHCIAVGHDWGCGLLSRLATYIPKRFIGVVPISVGYIQPDVLDEFTKDTVGYSTYGYWPWHNTEDAVKDCSDHPASVFTLIYAADPEDWKVNMAPRGAAAKYVRAGRIDPLPPWYTLDEYTIRDRILSQGYRGPLNWYKAAMLGVNDNDESKVPEENKICRLPTLLIVSGEDYVTRADLNLAGTKQWVPDLEVKTLADCGHWIQLEQPNELHRFLEGFASELAEMINLRVKETKCPSMNN